MKPSTPLLVILTLLPALCGCGRQITQFHPNGVRAAEGHSAWNSTREHGLWTYWYPSGSPRERGRYRNGRRVGTWIQWYPTGQKHSLGERVWDGESLASERQGPWTFWERNGQLAARGDFERGVRVGEWRFWLSDGSYDVGASGIYVAGERREPE